jgi:small subunit ribosomal protein S2
MPFVSRRWLGGMLTNYNTVKPVDSSASRSIEELIEKGGLERVTKKEGLMRSRAREAQAQGLGGIKDMDGIPDALFIIDVGHERIAVAEANKLGIPIVAVVDTNNSA